MKKELTFVKKCTNIQVVIEDKSDFWIQIGNLIYHVTEGTGDSLMQEDIDDGYVDYIYYDCYRDMNDVHEDNIYDGGMVLLKRLYKSMTLDEIVTELKNFVE